MPAAPQIRKNNPRENSLAEFVRVFTVSRRLNISRKRVYQLIQEKRLTAVKFGPRQTRVLRSSLDDYIRALMLDDENDEGESASSARGRPASYSVSISQLKSGQL